MRRVGPSRYVRINRHRRSSVKPSYRSGECSGSLSSSKSLCVVRIFSSPGVTHNGSVLRSSPAPASYRRRICSGPPRPDVAQVLATTHGEGAPPPGPTLPRPQRGGGASARGLPCDRQGEVAASVYVLDVGEGLDRPGRVLEAVAGAIAELAVPVVAPGPGRAVLQDGEAGVPLTPAPRLPTRTGTLLSVPVPLPSSP
jgi:hypothetical protein